MALVFDVQQANGKPDDNRRPGTTCPFCDTEGLTDIIRRDGDCIWLENKFKTLRATRQTVLIESADHDADLVTYEPDELHHVDAVCPGLLAADDRFAAVSKRAHVQEQGPTLGR